MGDSLGSSQYENHDWYETLNGKTGIFAIAVVIIFVSIIIITFIVRIIQFPYLRQQVINYFITDSTRSAPTRILKMIIFLFLTAGLVGVIYFNVYKMFHYPPKLSMSLEENDSFPSMLFCPNFKDTRFKIVSAKYYESISINNLLVNLIDSKVFQDIPGVNSDCKFFNGTLFPSFLEKKNFAGGAYTLIFNSSEVIIFMGDNNVDWINFIPQGKKFSDVESITLQTESRAFQYTETRIQVINGTIYRNFQMSFKGNRPFVPPLTDGTVGLFINAPARVTTMILRPSLTLVELFSNIGGYLSIWGVVVFLFGSGKMDPFGFVSRVVFIEQDRTKLLKELKKMKDGRSVKQSKIDIITETSNLDDQVELENLLAKYYVHMDFYKHAVKTSDV